MDIIATNLPSWISDSALGLLMNVGDSYISGERINQSTGVDIELHDPATGKVTLKIKEANQDNIENAVKSSREAFQNGEWRNSSDEQRQTVFHKVASLLEENLVGMSQLEALFTGMPLRDAENQVKCAASVFRYYAGWSSKYYGKVDPHSESIFSYTVYEPVGVCLGIIPWNFPLVLAAYKIAPALILGNSIVLKPAEETPITALCLAQFFSKSGLPCGMLNIITGRGKPVGSSLVEHDLFNKIAFTGSTKVGSSILNTNSSKIVRTSLELGGKCANIIFEDAEILPAVDSAINATWGNAGQACVAGSRLLIHESIHDQFLDLFVERTINLCVDSQENPISEMGPLISEKQIARVENYVNIGKEIDKATLFLGGNRIQREGYFFEPTIFTDVCSNMRIFQEEIFGPVLSVTKFSSDAHAINLANNTIYGLAASIWTTNLSRIHNCTKQIETGVIWVNTYGYFYNNMSFGGMKMSGVGRELGQESLKLYSEAKNIIIKYNH